MAAICQRDDVTQTTKLKMQIEWTLLSRRQHKIDDITLDSTCKQRLSITLLQSISDNVFRAHTQVGSKVVASENVALLPRHPPLLLLAGYFT